MSKKSQNYRKTDVKCCATCIHGCGHDGLFCQWPNAVAEPNETGFEVDEGGICDKWETPWPDASPVNDQAEDVKPKSWDDIMNTAVDAAQAILESGKGTLHERSVAAAKILAMPARLSPYDWKAIRENFKKRVDAQKEDKPDVVS